MTNREQAAYFQIAIENVAAVVLRTPRSVLLQYGKEALGDTNISLIQHAVKLEMIRLQVEDVLVTNWIPVKDNDYRDALHRLVCWNIQIENDPLVSVAARNRRRQTDNLVSLLKKAVLFEDQVVRSHRELIKWKADAAEALKEIDAKP